MSSTTPARPLAAPPAAPPVADRSADPWPTLAQAGLLKPRHHRDEPIDTGLDASTRAGLEQVVQRAADAGASFSASVSQGWDEVTFTPLTPREASALVMRQPLPFRDKLVVQLDGGAHLPVKSLLELQALDATCSLAVATGATPVPAAAALQALIAVGWSFETQSSVTDRSGLYPILSSIYQGEYVTARPRAGAEAGDVAERRVLVGRPDHMLALAFFEQLAPADGLRDRSFAEGLWSLEQRGYCFNSSLTVSSDRGGRDAYTMYSQTRSQLMSFGKPDGLFVRFTEAELCDIDRLEQRYAKACDLYARFGEPALQRVDAIGYRHLWISAVMRDENAPSLRPEVRAELLATLVAGHDITYSGQKLSLVDTAVEDLRALCGRTDDLKQLREEVSWFARMRRFAKPDGLDDEARLKHLRDQYGRECGTPAQYERARHDLVRLVDAMGSTWRALEAYDTVRTALGLERLDEGVVAVERLAQSDAARREEAVDNLRCVLTHRLSDESLEQAVTRFGELARALTNAGAGARTREMFARVQGTTRAAGDGQEGADARLHRLVSALPVCADADVALNRALSSTEESERAPATVETEGDGWVVLGGVRVQVRAAAGG